MFIRKLAIPKQLNGRKIKTEISKFVLLFFALLIAISCQKREWDNPFDPDCPKEIFTPSGFKAEQLANQVKLSWTQTNNNITGFKIERKVGDGSWAQIASLGEYTVTWDDKQPTGGKLHEYRIHAYAGNNSSNQITTQITPLFIATISTATVSNITSSSASCGGEVTNDGGAQVTERGVCWSTTDYPTTSGSKLTIGSGTGIYNNTITGLTGNTIYYVRAYAINSLGTAYGSQVSFRTATSGGETVSDVDGNVYNTIHIGTQVWMAENLKTTKYRDGTAIPNVTDGTAWSKLTTGAYCWYDNNVSNKGIYGALYNWYAVNTGKLCPAGWHVPSDAEWTTLENYLIANGYNYDGTTSGNNIAKSMATATGWNSHSGTGTVGNTDYPAYRNKSGFSALPGGYRNPNGSFHNIGDDGFWWSSTESSALYAWDRLMVYFYTYVYRGSSTKDYGYNIRCAKD